MNSQLLLEVVVHTLIGLVMAVYYSIVCAVKQLVPYKYRSKNIRGETMLITGSGSGIGKLMAKKFSKLGARVILVDIDEKNNKQTESEIKNDGGDAKAYRCDLSDKDDVYRVVREIKSSYGDITMLVNNAGIVTGKKLLDSSDELIDRTFKVNTISHFWILKELLPSMIEKNHGHIVTIASVAGLFGVSGLCDYCSSKFAAVGLDESLRMELQRLNKDGVKTTVVCPYYIDTGMFDGTDSRVIPLLDSDYAANKIVEAVLTDQTFLALPKIMYLFYALRGMLPFETMLYINSKAFKINQAMDHFTGRKKTN